MVLEMFIMQATTMRMPLSTREPKVGLDSQCLSYLLDAVAGIEEPTDALAGERKALIRIWFYTLGTFYVSETVVKEVGAIRTADRREFHDGFVQTLFLDLPVRDRAAVELRTAQLMVSHPQMNDCRVLAEAEDLGLCAILTYDREFKRRLDSASGVVEVMMPSAYWSSLNIPEGASPITAPHHSNPLSGQSWWRW